MVIRVRIEGNFRRRIFPAKINQCLGAMALLLTAIAKAAGQLELLDSPQWLEVHRNKVTIETNLPREATSLMRMTW